LDSLKIPESNWEYSEILRDSLTALAWGLDIEKFWEMPPQKRALLTGTVIVKSQMQAFEEIESAERNKPSKGKI
jgi:hypothetical protein